MRTKYIIVYCLFLACSLFLAHSIIPHHHHENIQEAEQHHHHEQGEHHHDEEKSEGHGHTNHLIHSPDFGNYVVKPSLKLPDYSPFLLHILFVASVNITFSAEFFAADIPWYPDISPPNLIHIPLPNGLRGSPYFISLA